MGSDKLMSTISRVLFLASFVLLAIAILERLVNFFGYTVLGTSYTPGRMLEFSAIMLLFVIAILIRQTREELRRRDA
jgi:uncharacterized metal-binding protein